MAVDDRRLCMIAGGHKSYIVRFSEYHAPNSPFTRPLIVPQIAIRVFRAATELEWDDRDLAEEDKLSLHRFKADEAYQVGVRKGP